MLQWESLLTGIPIWALLRAALILLVGIGVARLASAGSWRLANNKLSTHHALLVKKGVYYLVISVFIVSALWELGFNLSVLLGAAGIFSVALGFASQTSASNFISGLFLISEKPFAVGDVIKIGATEGEVLSIDLMSVKLRTFDNLYVRIPNETLIKTEVTTLTKYAIRRVSIKLVLAYHQDMNHVREVLLTIADENPLSLEEPIPMVNFDDFADTGFVIRLYVWTTRENYLTLRNGLMNEIKCRFEQEGIALQSRGVTPPFVSV